MSPFWSWVSLITAMVVPVAGSTWVMVRVLGRRIDQTNEHLDELTLRLSGLREDLGSARRLSSDLPVQGKPAA